MQDKESHEARLSRIQASERRRLGRLVRDAERETTNLLNRLKGKTIAEKREIVKQSNPLFYSMGTKLDPRPDEVIREEEYERERKANE